MGQYKDDEVVRRQIDKLLVKIATAEAGLGLDSTPREMTNAKSKQAKYLLQIKQLDIEFYDLIEPSRLETKEDRELTERFKLNNK